MPRLAKVVNFLAIRQVKQGTETTETRVLYSALVSMLALDLIFTESSICLRELLWHLQSSRDRCSSINLTFDTELWSELCARCSSPR